MISPTDQQVHCWAWLKNRLPNDSNLTMEDVTWKYTALNLIGPRAVDVLSELSYAPITPEHFPSLFCKEMSVGYANGIRVMSITHTGEPGFMLYIPIEVRVRDSLSSLKQLLACIIRNTFHADSGSRSVCFVPAEFPRSA